MSVPGNLEKLDVRLPSIVSLNIGGNTMAPSMNQELPVPQTVPVELGGKWLAWSADGLRIIAHGDSFSECKEEAKKAGEADPCYEKTPRPDVRIIGVAR